MVKTNYFNKFRKGKGKAKAKAKVVKAPRVPPMSFAKRVNQIIARNVENKYTDTKSILLDVCTKTTIATTWATWVPGSSATGTFLIPQGDAVNQRDGNSIKLKRWIVKGLIQPTTRSTTVSPAVIMPNTFTGYVDIYFGRLMNNLTAVPNTLDKMYQSGATDLTPTGAFNEQLFSINKDLYKIHYHKRFKLGGSSNTSFYTNGQANDFNLTRSFGFDVTKYILKNKHLKFDELSTQPQNPELSNLTFWAVFHSSSGTFVGNSSIDPQYSFYQIQLMTYAEFEDM